MVNINKIRHFVITLPFQFIILAAFFGFSNTAEKTAEISLPTIQCGSCVRTIEKALGKLDGITNIDIDVENKKATISFDESKTNISSIEDAISAAGYDANDKKADPTAYSKLHTCCKLPKDR